MGMYDRTLDNPKGICPKCEHMQKYLNSPHDASTLGDLRTECQHCAKFSKGGIYKGDLAVALVMTVNELNKNLTPGRKPTRHREYGEVITNLREQGFSLRKIAETVGISVNTVRSILKEELKND